MGGGQRWPLPARAASAPPHCPPVLTSPPRLLVVLLIVSSSSSPCRHRHLSSSSPSVIVNLPSSSEREGEGGEGPWLSPSRFFFQVKALPTSRQSSTTTMSTENRF